MNSKHAQEERLLEAALALETETERRAFPASVADPALRQRLEELIASSTGADCFFAHPAVPRAPAEIQDSAPTSQGEAHADEVAAQMIGRYKLLEKIGEGGFGEVWMAEQREPVKRRVALKIIKLGMDT